MFQKKEVNNGKVFKTNDLEIEEAEKQVNKPILND